MARTKGALGKKTIDKLKAQGKWDYKNNRPLNKPIDKSVEFSHTQSNIKVQHQNPNINAKKVPLVERLKKNPELRKTIGVNNGDNNDGDSINNINSNRNPVDNPSSNNSDNERLIETEDNTEVKIKENSETTEIKIPEPTENQTESKPKNKLNKELKPKTFCDACHEPIYCDANRVDTNVLTSRADYFREVPRFVNLCSKCSLELSNVVDKWLLDKGCYSKYQSAINTQEDSNIKENLNNSESKSEKVSNEGSSIEKDTEDSRKEFQ